MTRLKSSHSLTVVAVVFFQQCHLENILLLRCFSDKSRKQTGSITTQYMSSNVIKSGRCFSRGVEMGCHHSSDLTMSASCLLAQYGIIWHYS